jgi:hypothetical protein
LTEKKTVTVFYSYSHKDDKYRDKLETHLSLLKRQGIIREWHDRKISAGEDWKVAIDKNLESADIILLLVSSDFIASDYCWGIEMKRALSRYKVGKTRLIPIIVRPVDLKDAPFRNIEPLPKNTKPITLWKNRDQAWLEVANGIREAAVQVASGRSKNEFERPIAESFSEEEITNLDTLKKKARSGDEQAITELSLSGSSDAYDVLSSILEKNPQDKVRESAANALVNVTDSRKVELLGKTLLSEKWLVAAACAQVLGRTRDPASIPYLIRGIELHVDWLVAQKCAEALSYYEPKD